MKSHSGISPAPRGLQIIELKSINIVMVIIIIIVRTHSNSFNRIIRIKIDKSTI